MHKPKLVKQLLEAGFFLGGSRRMAEKFPGQIKITPNTDWDLYGADTDENYILLEKLGLLGVSKNDYSDDLLTSIYRDPTTRIQAVLRSDVVLYNRAFESLDAPTFIYKCWKSAPQRRQDEDSQRVAKNYITKFFNQLFEKIRQEDK